MKRSPTLRGRRALVALAALTLSGGGGAYAAAAPAPKGAPSADVSMAGSGSAQIGYGKQVQIRGAVKPRTPGKVVRLEHAARGGGGYRLVARRQTRSDGSYAFTPTARRSGSFRAVVDRAASAAKRLTVVSALTGRATRHVLGGRPVRVRGSLEPGRAGRTVALELASRGRWRTVERARTAGGGRFTARWQPRAAGTYRLRVRSVGDSLASASTERLARVRAYRPGVASYYGPGLYGNRLGCGGTLTPGTLGVAHKSLPCGAKVALRYRGRTVTVPVVDRGPYVAGREWDLTEATRRRLHFGTTGTVWSTR